MGHNLEGVKVVMNLTQIYFSRRKLHLHSMVQSTLVTLTPRYFGLRHNSTPPLVCCQKCTGFNGDKLSLFSWWRQHVAPVRLGAPRSQLPHDLTGPTKNKDSLFGEDLEVNRLVLPLLVCRKWFRLVARRNAPAVGMCLL